MESSGKHGINVFVFRDLADGSSSSSSSSSSGSSGSSSSSGSGGGGGGGGSGSSGGSSSGHNISEDRPQARGGTARDVSCLA